MRLPRMQKRSGGGPAAAGRPQAGEKPLSGRASVQGWLPVRDVAGDLIVRRDGHLVAAIRVEPAPFALLSPREQGRQVRGLFEALQGLDGPVQILALPRPLDLDRYILDLQGRLSEADGPRRVLLRGYLGYVRTLASTGGAVERRFYLLLPGGAAGRRGADEELRGRAGELAAGLTRAGLGAHPCDEREITDLLYVFLHPAQAAFERAEDYPDVLSVLFVADEPASGEGTA